MTTTLTQKSFKEFNIGIHRAAHGAFATLFQEDRNFKQYHLIQGKDRGLGITHGYQSTPDTFVPVCEIVVGAKLHNKHRLPQVTAQGVLRLFRQTFPNKKAWVGPNQFVETKQLITPISEFLVNNAGLVDVFAGVYRNEETYSNVFGMVALLKNCVGQRRVSMELTIDDVNLVEANAAHRLFK